MDQRQGRWAVPPFLERAAAWSWRLVVVTGATYVVLWLVSQLQVVVIAVFIAIIAAAALDPVVSWMQRRRIPRLLATWIGLLVIGGVLVGVGFLFIPPFIDELSGWASRSGRVSTKVDGGSRRGPWA